MPQDKKPFSEKFEDKALDVAGKVVEEGAKQALGLGSALGWLIKLGALSVFLIVIGVIALVAFLVVKFL